MESLFITIGTEAKMIIFVLMLITIFALISLAIVYHHYKDVKESKNNLEIAVKTLSDSNKQLTKNNNQIRNMITPVNEKNVRLKHSLDDTLKASAETIEILNKEINQRNSTISRLAETLIEKDIMIKHLETRIIQLDPNHEIIGSDEELE